MEAFESTLEAVLQASYYNTNNGLKTAMFQLVEQALGEDDRSTRVPTVSKSEMQSLLQMESVADTVDQAALSNTGLIVPILEIVGKLVDRAVGEECLLEIELEFKTAGRNNFL